MAGYQRSLNAKRTAPLAKYLETSPRNIVPGAIIVAVDANSVSVEKDQDISEITISEDARDFQTKLQELWGAFTTRLSSDELASADILFTADDWETNLADESESEYPASYLALLAKELTAAVTDWHTLPLDRRQAIQEFIEGTSKPGLIIDGQHRVHGAADVNGGDIALPVVLIPGLEHAEQVFQFYVLNSKAKPLKPTELRRIVSTSLTNQEIEKLYHRFKQAGVDAEEARWTYEINTSQDSPFRNLIDFGYGEPGAIIKENVADQLVRAFMKMPSRRYGQLISPLGDVWRNPERRLDIFFWLWTSVKDVYSEAWNDATCSTDNDKQPQLFMKVALLTLQKFLLDRFVTALPYRDSNVPPLSSPEEVYKMVSSTLKNLPGEFFRREWKVKQIDTNEGRMVLYKAMEAVWNDQGKMHGNMKIFQG